MIIIQEQKKVIKTVLEPQAVDSEATYRVADFCVKSVIDGKTVIYHSLTGEVCELDEREAELLRDGTVATDENKELIEHYFLVPKEYDEIELANEIHEFVKVFEKSKGINGYTIFTTMDCNARCFYCYEMGRPRTPMSEQTAKDVVQFIKKSANPKKPVSISWFGGEPLYNQSVIDIITSGLRKEGIEFRSTMVTNGFLCDAATAKKAKECWNLKRVQISLDGTEEIYNRSKAFIYEGVNSFKVVTDNIEGLLKEDVFVSIRLNLGEHNKEDLYKLVEWIDKRYPDKSHLSVYAHLLFEYYDNAVKDDLRGTLAADLIELEDYCRRVGLRNDRTFTDGIKTTRCMADNDGAITITPTGKLGKCEHYTEDNFAGDIYNGITDPDTVARFKERSNTKEICSGCAAYPSCIILKMCPDVGNTVCNNAARKIAETALERSLVATYKKIKEQKNKAK